MAGDKYSTPTHEQVEAALSPLTDKTTLDAILCTTNCTHAEHPEQACQACVEKTLRTTHGELVMACVYRWGKPKAYAT